MTDRVALRNFAIFIGALVVAGITAAVVLRDDDPRAGEDVQTKLDALRAANIEKWKSAPRSRTEFEAAVIDKCGAAITADVGTPDSTQSLAGTEFWYWRGKTRDPTTGKLDSSAQVVIEAGCARQAFFS